MVEEWGFLLRGFLPVTLFLAFSFRIQKFKQKSAILAGKIEEFRGAIFSLTENTTLWYQLAVLAPPKRVFINSIYESFERHRILQVEFSERVWNKFHLTIPIIRIEITCIPNKCTFIIKCFPSTEWGYIMKRAIKKVPM